MRVTAYLAFNLSHVKVAGGETRFKKIFGAQKSDAFDKIDDPSSFRFRRLKFTSAAMEDASGRMDKFFVLNINALLSGGDIDAEEILNALRRQQKVSA